MKTRDFSFEIPSELIAQQPAPQREQARLLCMPRGGGPLRDRHVFDLPELLPADALMVFNNTRVRPCRLLGRSASGAQVELLLLEARDRLRLQWSVMAGPARRARPGAVIELPDGLNGEVIAREQEIQHVRFSRAVDDRYLEAHGHVPLPPYIRRGDTSADRQRYQTVFAARYGSAAAPTAGLHFTPQLLQRIDQRGIERCFVTLHVGLGTFRPMRSENVVEHRMHRERYSVPAASAAAVTRAKRAGRPIIAVGTTSVRTLESAWSSAAAHDRAVADAAGLAAGDGETELFIYPGFRFQVVDEMITNFHTPESSLVVMVAAFAGREAILSAYRHAVGERYRFFSYGDAMYLHQ